MSSTNTTHWSLIKEGGTLLGLKFLWLMHRLLGRWMVSFMLLPTVAYFLLFKPSIRRSSYQFLLVHYEFFPEYWKHRPNYRNVARHFWEFSESVVDKLMSWVIDIDSEQFNIVNEDYLESIMADKRGRLIIGSHFGNLESCRGFVHRYRDKVINILIHDKHSENYNTLMKQLNPESRVNIFQVSEFDVQTMLRIKAKIDQGEWIFIAGDRVPPSGAKRTVDVEFIGRTASLPIGPYMLAKALACPVDLIFSSFDHSTPSSTVRVELIKFSEKIELDRVDRNTQLQQFAQRYALELEKQCARTPYQWFNFYSFWKDDQLL